MKLILLSLVATLVAAVSLAAVAQSATTAQTVRVTEVDYSIRLSAKPKPGAVKFVDPERRRRRARLLAQGRRQDLEDARHRRAGLRHADRHAEEGRPVLLLVRGRHRTAEGHERQLRRPLATSSGAPRPALPASRADGHTSPMAHTKRTILLVEDEESITTPLAEALERDGFHTEIAHTVADGLAQGKDACAPISSCSTSGCRTARGSTSAASCARRRASRSSSSRRAARRRTASSGSSSAPTTTSSSRSAPAR